MGARALVSIGTNSTRLVVMQGDAIVLARSTGTRLGRDLGATGTLDPEARERTLAVIADYADDVRGRGATIDAIATSALRRASDAPTFSAEVEAILGVAPRIISGDEEAAYSFLGATWGVGATGRTAVLDVGGGSTELAIGTGDRIERTISCEIGAVRLSERHRALLGERALSPYERETVTFAARADAALVLQPLKDFRGCDELLAVGGTVFTAAGMIAGDPRRDGVTLSAAERRTLIDNLLSRDLERRRILEHIRPQRADILPAGLIIVDVACGLLAIDTLRVSHADLLAGYLRSPDYVGHRVTSVPGGSSME
jgi:exopolyphosphatase/guanosine-5'-triphosphate,3'-diphosphate pyrophosphatase